MRRGARIGVDVGKARIGLAASDPSGLIATPIATIARSRSGSSDVDEVVQAAAERDAIEIVVGLPIALSGAETASTRDAREFALLIAQASSLSVRMVDERLSSVSAHAALHRAGRTVKSSRSIIDQVAAVIILQHALDQERTAGRPPGVLVDPTKGSQ